MPNHENDKDSVVLRCLIDDSFMHMLIHMSNRESTRQNGPDSFVHSTSSSLHNTASYFTLKQNIPISNLLAPLLIHSTKKTLSLYVCRHYLDYVPRTLNMIK